MFVCFLSCKSCGATNTIFSESRAIMCPTCGSRDTHINYKVCVASTDWNQYKHDDKGVYQVMVDVIDDQVLKSRPYEHGEKD